MRRSSLRGPRARLTLVHTAVAALGALELIRTLHQTWVRLAIREEPALLAFVVALPVASALASIVAIVLGARTGLRRRALVTDLATLGSAFAAALLLSLPMGPNARGVVGLLYVAVLALRLAPSVALVLRGRERSGAAVFALSLVFYGAVAVWSGAATAAQGDQPHYLLAADRLARGSLDLAPAYADDALFGALTGGLHFGPGDVETHVARAPVGDRLVQGYGLALLIAPGWAVWGKTGALLILALVAAFASLQTWQLCRETVDDARHAAVAWAATAFLAPLPTLAGAVYPNVVGAAAIVWSYRLLFTAERRRPLRAGLVAGTVLLLTPRDAVAVLLFAPFVVPATGVTLATVRAALQRPAAPPRPAALELPAVSARPAAPPRPAGLELPAVSARPAALAALVGRDGRRFGVAFVGMLLAVSLFDLVAYGVPLPYAGYGFGIEMAQRLDALPTLSFHAEIGLPGILFDKAFGLAGSAPWFFIGLAGVGAALARRRGAGTPPDAPAPALVPAPALAPTLAPALVAAAGSVLALSVYRLWRGGWSPPNRYVVDVLPLWAPFVGLALPRLRGLVGGTVVWSLLSLSALATFLLVAVPNLGFNLSDTANLAEALEDVLPVSPFSWLPSFQAPDPAALVAAWLWSIPLWAGCALLLRRGFTRGPA